MHAGLIVFYLATRDLLKPFKPVIKFVLVKGVIFFTFWQGFTLALLTSARVLESAHDAVTIQNSLICLEMLVASLCTLLAFPHKQYIVVSHKQSAGAQMRERERAREGEGEGEREGERGGEREREI